MNRLTATILILLCCCSLAHSTTMPSGTGYCVWRPMAPNEEQNVSGHFQQVMDEWGYNCLGHEYIEVNYGNVTADMYGNLMLNEPSLCKFDKFLDEVAANHACFFFASHANRDELVVSAYEDSAAAAYASSLLGSIHGFDLRAVQLRDEGLWGVAIKSSNIQSRCNAQIVMDISCYNKNRFNDWGSDPLVVLGYDGDDPYVSDVLPKLESFLEMLRFTYGAEDLEDDFTTFPEAYKHSFAEADDHIDFMTVHVGGDVVLGPTFIPWRDKHFERDGEGPLEVVFDLNLPCHGMYFIKSLDSDIAQLLQNGFDTQGNMLINLNITGAKRIRLYYYSNFITSNINQYIRFNGGEDDTIRFSVDTTPIACIEDFSVADGTAKIIVSSLNNTECLMIEGGDSTDGPFSELVRLDDSLRVGLNLVSGLPVCSYYRLRETETDGDILFHNIVEPIESSAWSRSASKSNSNCLLGVTRKPDSLKSPSGSLAILAPSSMAAAVNQYRDLRALSVARIDVYWIDDFWNGTADPDTFRAREKDFIADLVADGHDTFLLVGDASDAKEIQSPWPAEYGWEEHRLELLAGDYEPQPEKNIHPSPVYWYNPVISQDAGVNLPYFFTDWLLLDLDGDDFPDPGLVIGRLPFNTQSQLYNYYYKLYELLEYGVPDVPIKTLALNGDVNHVGDFDGVHADSVMADHLRHLDWPVTMMRESEYGSDLSRTTALRNAWQDPGQMWNFVVCVAGYSTRYRLGNWINNSFNFNFAPEVTHYPFMFLNTCTTGNFWWTENGGYPPRVEYLLEHRSGSGGVFAHSDGSWQEPCRSLGNFFLDNVMEDQSRSWGESAALAVQQCKTVGVRERINALRTVLLSDPLLQPLAFNPDPQMVTGGGALPSAARVVGNHPNPFNPSTTIDYEVAAESGVEISVFDVSGSLIKVLFDGRRIKGRYEVIWDGTDSDGRTVASGAYICRMVAGSDESTAKMILVR